MALDLSGIKRRFQDMPTFDAGLIQLEAPLKELLGADQLRVYKFIRRHLAVVAACQTPSGPAEVRLLLTPKSVAGYTGLRRIPILLRDVEDPVSLDSIHTGLTFDRQYDTMTGVHTQSLLSMPLTHGDLMMGVFQAVRVSGQAFGRGDEAKARLLAGIMAGKLHKDFDMTDGPLDHLVRTGELTQAKAAWVLAEAVRRKTWPSLILRQELGVSPDRVAASLERYYDVHSLRYSDRFRPPDALLRGINRSYLVSNLWVPLARSGGKAVVLVSNPEDKDRIEEIPRILAVHDIDLRVGLPEEILAYLGDKSRLPPGDYSSLPDLGLSEGPEPDEPALSPGSEDQDDAFAEDVPDAMGDPGEEESVDFKSVDAEEIEDISVESKQQAVRYVNRIIAKAHQMGASDIHIEPAKSGRPGLVRMRVDGVCHKIMQIPDSLMRPVVSRIKIISGLNIAERRRAQDGKTKVKLRGRELELRIATLPTVHGESAVLRLLASSGALPFDKLNLSAANTAAVENILAKKHGIFLVVGPTGSGKTTTLHSILGRINTPDKKIWTAEDPVEITQPGLQQVQVSPGIGWDFAAVLKSFLRADPDVILIGEMRDFETANIGVEASLTGHLVFSTLHTNSAPETITRLIDLGLNPFNFADALRGILAQRLVRTLCPSCKQPGPATPGEIAELTALAGEDCFHSLTKDRNNITLHRPAGCRKCSQSGYRGRTGIHELLASSPEIVRLISRKSTVEDIRRQAMLDGMRSLMQDGVAKILKGDTDLEQLKRVVSE